MMVKSCVVAHHGFTFLFSGDDGRCGEEVLGPQAAPRVRAMHHDYPGYSIAYVLLTCYRSEITAVFLFGFISRTEGAPVSGFE